MYDGLLESRQRQRDEGGFTLIELLIVIVILGILAAIVVFAVSGITDNGTTSACKSDVKTIDTAAEAYFAQKNTGALNITQLEPGFLHTDSQIDGTLGSAGEKVVTNKYTITFAAGTATSAGGADTTSLAGCP